MDEMSRTLYRTVAVAVVFVAIALAVTIILPIVDGNHTEKDKMVACVKSGGQWVKNLNYTYDCKRGN